MFVLKYILKVLLIVFLVTFGVTFFLKSQYRNVESIDQGILKAPMQKEIINGTKIDFIKAGYQYELTPVASYEINAMVVHKMDYRLFSLNKSDKVFPIDLCMVWGDNISQGVYKNRDLVFSQDMRFCFYRYVRDIGFHNEMVSNNHLVVYDDKLVNKINSVNSGDQVKIIGKLVNIKAREIGKEGNDFEMQTSITRSDTGAGACEIIYVEDFKILKQSHPLIVFAYSLSLKGLLIIIVLSILIFISEFLRIKKI